MKIVQAKGLTKKYGDTVTVDIISHGIHEGEIFGLLGPNGAGKSTAIHMISGLLPMDKGIIDILGKDIRKNSAFAKNNTGIVPQEFVIYEDLTAYENVHFFEGL